jgi:Domain of unknown function (DUF4217)
VPDEAISLDLHTRASHLDSALLANAQLAANKHVGARAQVPLNEYEFPTAKLANVQAELQRLVEKNYYLHQSAKDAYRAYVLAYNSHSLKDTFNVHTLDLAAIAQSFGFLRPPKVRRARGAARRRLTCCTCIVQHVPCTAAWYSVQRLSELQALT